MPFKVPNSQLISKRYNFSCMFPSNNSGGSGGTLCDIIYDYASIIYIPL